MNKTELSKLVGLSRPTIDKWLKIEKKRELLLFIMSFSVFEYNERLERLKKQ